ncbi:NUDIX hydrolase [Candidatus Roizmanbacteria bacterium]|nr:NUDIX hydrolase [Candidatus Roizmanbacteria bacterium]
MKDEYVDIVDENNKILYEVSKTKAHKNGFLHRTVIAEMIDSKGRWVLVLPRSHKQDAGQYVSPVGGHVTSGETVKDALIREAYEEVGLKDFKFKLVGRKIFNRFVLGRQENHFFIVYEIYTDKKPILGDETNDYKYFTKKEIKEKMKSNPKIFGDAFHFVYKHIYREFK